MGLFDRLKTKAVAGVAPFINMFQDRWTLTLGEQANEGQFLKQYKNWIYACVNCRSREVGNIDLFVREGKDKESTDEHELLDLLYKANPNMTKYELFYGTQAYLDLTGNAFWYLAREGKNADGKVKEIYLLRPDKVKIILDKDNALIVHGYAFTQANGKDIPFTPKQILHFKNFNPNSNFPISGRGMGVVQASASAIEIDNESRVWNYSFFKNSARPDGLLIKETGGQMSAEEYTTLKRQFNQEHGGSSKAHKVGFLSGAFKWQEVSKSVKDMDFVEQRRFSRDEILALFQVPKAVIGIVEDVSRSNAEATDYIFASRCIKPLMQTIVDTLNEYLADEFGDSVRLDFKSPVPQDRVALTNEYAVGIDKWLTRNEVRAKEGLPPLKNGDVIMGTLAQVPIDEVAPQKAKDTKPQIKTKKASDLIDDFIAKLPEYKSADDKNKKIADIKEKWLTIWKQEIEVRVGALKKDVVAYFEKQEKEVLSNVKDELKGIKKSEYSLKSVDDFLFDDKNAIKVAISLITPHIQNYIEQSGGQATDLIGGADVFDMESEAVLEFIQVRAKYFAKTINETTSNELMSAIEAGLEDGETADEISERVAQVYGKAKDYRTDMIARTEVSAASNFGASEGYLQAGISQHQWVVVDPQDEDCLVNEGQTVNIGDEFNSGDINAPIHPQCVCTTVPIFD